MDTSPSSGQDFPDLQEKIHSLYYRSLFVSKLKDLHLTQRILSTVTIKQLKKDLY